MTTPRRLFIAGATGATGRTLLRRNAQGPALDLLPHLRPASAGREGAPRPAAIFDLGDHAALVEALRGCTTAVQLIGTMRKRFGTGDTYETSDIGTTRQLVEASKEAGVDHIVLLSSVGAGRPLGAYLKAKAEAESLVRGSGLPWTILRPSAFVGEGHRPPPGTDLMARLIGYQRFRTIRIEQLADLILKVAGERAPLNEVLEGASLWRHVPAE